MRYVLIFLLTFVCFSMSALALTTKYASGEATVLDFDWKPAEEIPADIVQSRPLKKWKKSFAADPRGWAEFDLDGNDRTRDVIIGERDFPSGGRAFLLLSKKPSGTWRELAAFRGAPIFSERDTAGFPELQVYWRSGDIGVTRFRFKSGRYHRVDEYTMPRVINDECFYRKWQVWNRMKVSDKYQKCYFPEDGLR